MLLLIRKSSQPSISVIVRLKKEEISINLSGGDFLSKKLFPLTTQIALHGKENEGIEQKLNESNKFAGAA